MRLSSCIAGLSVAPPSRLVKDEFVQSVQVEGNSPGDPFRSPMSCGSSSHQRTHNASFPLLLSFVAISEEPSPSQQQQQQQPQQQASTVQHSPMPMAGGQHPPSFPNQSNGMMTPTTPMTPGAMMQANRLMSGGQQVAGHLQNASAQSPMSQGAPHPMSPTQPLSPQGPPPPATQPSISSMG